MMDMTDKDSSGKPSEAGVKKPYQTPDFRFEQPDSSGSIYTSEASNQLEIASSRCNAVCSKRGVRMAKFDPEEQGKLDQGFGVEEKPVKKKRYEKPSFSLGEGV